MTTMNTLIIASSILISMMIMMQGLYYMMRKHL
jgi:hypothetical protein